MADDILTRSYTVAGMTCAHCVASVSEEVGTVPGVRGVEVDLASGRMLVHGERVSDADVRAAVEEAGYELTG
jgi:copper chaperone